MKKLFPFLLLMMMSLSVSAQIPSYYNDVNLNQTGTALKDALAVKITSSHHTNLSYTPGVWDALKQTDLDPNDSSKVILIYGYSDTDGNYVTDRTRSKDANGGSAGTQWNREHTYAKSLGNPNLGTSGPGADAHHLRPADISFNSQRSSKKFAAGTGNAGNVTGGWYPGDEWKGDVARMMMYMYLRYGNQCLPTGVGTGSTMASDANMLSLFIQWNVEDPVSDFEKQRNPILESIQGNRNPFIDNPAFATEIWGGPQAEDLFGGGSGGGDTQAPTAPTNLTAANITQTTVDLSWGASTDNTAVIGYRIYEGGIQVGTTVTTNFTVSNLTAGTSYTFTVRAYDAASNISTNSNTAAATTTSSGGGGGSGTTSDLFISEYIEGSSNNKALEIANFTGATINLSNYSLKKASNGGGSWSNTLNLSGQLANGEVYVIANSSATTAIKNVADLNTTNSVMTFNGNDAVGLFKSDALIDLIGNPSSSANFAQNTTIRRKSSVTSPNTSYTTSEWDSYSQDTFSGLGSHTVNGGATPPSDTTAPTAPTNMAATNITQTSANLSWTASSDNLTVTGYDVYRGATKVATVTSTSYSVSGLTASTTYSFSVRAFDAAGNTSSTSNTINVTTLGSSVSYCPSKGSNASYEWIDNVAIGGISNTSGANNGYGDFTNLTGNLTYGNNNIIVSAGFSSSSYTEFWKVWIDFNQNGTFEASEEVVSGSSSSSGNLSYTFSVPTSANAGATRMRVSMKWDATQTACESFSYGEVEDYTVNIGSAARGISNKTSVQVDGTLGNEARVFDAIVYPNPSSNYININLKDGRDASFRVINLIGQTVKDGQANRNVDIRDLQNGMYILEVNDGQRAFTKKFIKK
ncbi:putative secreted protein (Por secretion system target) [Tenacibaculum adriaticum]|uniref:Putative secreted protein (Por secretion system target) n=1 Tax=Tenacibaculum adriaticum TaxID=413713 RepID=A0A5S5DTV3_9FLAO|nr:endonuclease [Tenacibaculum adriaticum]TYP98798.1 putative secreted protein (Por secretion system target) [Tenacibaculum adriaticum]